MLFYYLTHKKGNGAMIIDNIDNLHIYYGISKRLDMAFDYIKNCEPSKLELGKFEIDGDNLFILVQEYKAKPMPEGKWEAHKKYIDIQYITSGQELMGYAQLDKLNIIEEYDKDKDILFAEGKGDFFKVCEGSFAIFMPWDAHMPGLTTGDLEDVRKIVVKVLAD